jgi:hypothetical protein
VAKSVIVGCAEHPLLLADIPLGPGIERHHVRPAPFAKVGYTLAVVCHAASLALLNRRSNPLIG